MQHASVPQPPSSTAGAGSSFGRLALREKNGAQQLAKQDSAAVVGLGIDNMDVEMSKSTAATSSKPVNEDVEVKDAKADDVAHVDLSEDDEGAQSEGEQTGMVRRSKKRARAPTEDGGAMSIRIRKGAADGGQDGAEGETDEEEEDEDEADESKWAMSADADDMEAAERLRIRQEFDDPLDFWDPSMVAEYSDEIFAYMHDLEVCSKLSFEWRLSADTSSCSCSRCPILATWSTRPRSTGKHTFTLGGQGTRLSRGSRRSMRSTLVDWLLQVHMRYHMLPETLWIAVNIVDRFLSNRVVSRSKLQLVGVTAMFVAAKYEEIMAPSVDEFVYMCESGYTKDEILKGERIILTSLEFAISSYCTPYSWVRRISKADDYDLQTRTLSKFLMEVTLQDHRFLRAKPSLVAAVGMFLSRKMLGNDWVHGLCSPISTIFCADLSALSLAQNDAFIFYSDYCESQLVAPTQYILEIISAPGFDSQFVYKKYSSKSEPSLLLFCWATTDIDRARRVPQGEHLCQELGQEPPAGHFVAGGRVLEHPASRRHRLSRPPHTSRLNDLSS